MNAPTCSRPSSYFPSSSSRPAKYGAKLFLGGTVLLLSRCARVLPSEHTSPDVCGLLFELKTATAPFASSHPKETFS